MSINFYFRKSCVLAFAFCLGSGPVSANVFDDLLAKESCMPSTPAENSVGAVKLYWGTYCENVLRNFKVLSQVERRRYGFYLAAPRMTYQLPVFSNNLLNAFAVVRARVAALYGSKPATLAAVNDLLTSLQESIVAAAV